MDVRAIDFKHLWRQLRSVGWASKRPSGGGLEKEWTYTSPTGVSFTGENAVMTFAIDFGIIVDESGESEEEVSGDEVVPADDPVTASQIDTSIALSTNTIETMFGSDSDYQSDAEGQLEPSDRELVVGAFQRLLSGAESNNSDGDDASDGDGASVEGGASVNGDGSVVDDDRVAVPANDVNVMADGELSDEYEAVDSSGSDSSANSGDEVIERREYPDDTLESDEDVAHMDDAFVEALGGKLTLEDIDKDALRRFEWSPPSSNFEPDSEGYPRLSTAVATPTRELQDIADPPMMLLFYFLPKSLWVSITKETNRYKKQTAHARAKRIRSKQRKRSTATPETAKQIERRLRAEHAYQPHEILHVIGLLVARMLNSMTRRFSRHWTMTQDGAILAGNYGKFMARNRCTSILRDFHVVNNEAPRIRDKMWKLRPVVDTLQSRFRSGWSLGSKYSFDEGVLPATSKRNTTRMFMPNKPHRYGAKLFMVCDSVSAYCHR
ncbi:hypothetical protein PC128_g24886 [Phytophthora cactorum]|nr:hypothetical protein PC128_g24886 [Phytophthora cactorum]